VLQKFSSFQTDGMVMEAGFITVFFAPAGLRPGLGAASPPSRLARIALVWLFFRVYFESGLAKVAGDPQWSGLTAMDHYYENGPLPTWLAWDAQEFLPHAFHATTTFLTLAIELVLVWGAFLPRPFRRGLFCVVTPFQIGIIATANYGCLNYLTLTLGFLLLDDEVFARLGFPRPAAVAPQRRPVWQGAAALLLGCQLSATAAILLRVPVTTLAPFHIANRFALFGTLTTDHPELEFQGSEDGQHWVAYPFRSKPQDLQTMPGFQAPYQPRFDLALTFAALDGNWHHNDWITRVEARLLEGSPDVLRLFRADPFAGHPPAYVRAVRWLYSFSTPAQRRADGSCWQREWSGTFGPTLHRSAPGRVDVAEVPGSGSG
jgi:hypothetical protein